MFLSVAANYVSTSIEFEFGSCITRRAGVVVMYNAA